MPDFASHSRADQRPAKLAFCITELDPGGAERTLVELVTRLDRQAFAPVVYCLGPRPRGNPISLADRLEAAGVPLHFLGARSKASFARVFAQLARQLAADRPELLQTFLFHANVLGACAARRAGVPHVVTGIRVAERQSRWHLIAARWADRWVDRHVCVSGAVRDFSVRHGLLPVDKLVVIPNAVDVDRFATAQGASRESLGASPHARLITCVGRIDRQKGSRWLIEALRPLLETRTDCELVMVGDGPQRGEVERFCAEHMPGKVHFLGARGDVPEILAASDLAVLPSRWEGMPNVVLEAMAAGLPIVATDVEGVREALGDGAAEQIAPPDDPAGFLKRVIQLLDDASKAAALGRANQRRVREKASFEHMVGAYQALYRSLLENAPAR